MRMRKQFSNEFKAKVALEALKGQKTIAEICTEFGVHATQVSAWRNILKEQMGSIFGHNESAALKEKDETIDQLYKTVGQMKLETEWLKKKLNV